MLRKALLAASAGLLTLALAAPQLTGDVTAKPRPTICYPGAQKPATWTYMKNLPPPQLCNGTIIEHYGKVCIHCGGFAPTFGQTCVTCKSGYSWNSAKKQCCARIGRI